jgi:cyclophilin family peptidyl-prolyl cis-trans isomerase
MATEKRQRKKSGRQARQQAMAEARRRQSRKRSLIVAVVIIAIAALIGGVTGAFSTKSKAKKVASTATSTKRTTTTASGPDTPCPNPDGSSPRTTQFAKAPPNCIDTAKTYTATMRTSQGDMTITLDPKRAPQTVNNFVVLSRYHFYDGVSCHRIIPGFVIQCGDPQGTGQGGPGYKFPDELPKPGQYKIGSLAMANSGPNTNGSQFFVITGQQGVQLPPQYSLFGQVTAGMDTAQKIDALGAPSGTPKEKVTIVSVTIRES